MTRTGRARRLRGVVTISAFLIGIAFLLTCCPSNRDGMPGQLAAAKEATQSAARSGALALDQWGQGRSTRQLTCVQLADARDEVVKAYQGVAALTAQDPVDLDRQRMLTVSMTSIIDQLNTANAAVRAPASALDPQALGRDLLAAAADLEGGYR